MARIQILELPDEEVGSVSVTPFALIIDQFNIDDAGPLLGIDAFAEQCGARSVMIFPGSIDLPGLTADEIATINRPFVDGIRELVETVGPRQAEEHHEAASPTPLVPTVDEIQSALVRAMILRNGDPNSREAAERIHDALTRQADDATRGFSGRLVP